jgi:V/A-type H+/Na+-transporting ATPase subunit E
MALTELLTTLEADAAAESARLEAEAREQARLVVEAARAEARAIVERAARADEAELARETAQRTAAARLAAANALRETREEGFRTLLTTVQARLAALRGSDAYRAVLGASIRESLAALPAAAALRVDPRDERLATEFLDELVQRLPLAAILETAGGVELAGNDGSSVRNTLEERLSNAEPALRLLFGAALPHDEAVASA